MKRLKLLTYTVMGVLVISLAAGANAWAAELQNLPAKLKFTLGAGEEGGAHVFIIETLSGRKVECKNFKGEGEFTSERLGPAAFEFSGCSTVANVKCTGLTDAEGSITVKGEFHTRHLLPNSEGVNAVMLASAVHFSCLGLLFIASGCVASMDLLTKEGGASIVNLLRASVYIDLLQEKGEQKPTEVDADNGLAMENCQLLVKEGTSANETAGLLDFGAIGNFRNSEGESVTELVDLSGTF